MSMIAGSKKSRNVKRNETVRKPHSTELGNGCAMMRRKSAASIASSIRLIGDIGIERKADQMSQDQKLRPTEPIEPVGRVTIDKLIAVCPERTEEWLALWQKGFPKVAVLRLIEEYKEARRPKMHTATHIAERTLLQSARELATKHQQEWAQVERRQGIVEFWTGLAVIADRQVRRFGYELDRG
jgi:hypothetical protein